MKDEQLAAFTRLEGKSWHQGKDSVKDYIDWFSELVDIAEYLDDKTIVIKFHKGLNPDVQNMVATLGECTPGIDKPERWFEAAQKVSQNWDANEAFLESNQRKTCIPPCSMFVKDSPAPMEVDQAQPRRGYPIVCHHCNQAGHYTWNCPWSYDV